MGDDEFFSGLGAPTRANAPRNPLTLDEITSLSRKFLNIAFTLFWKEDQIGARDGCVPGVSIKWDTVRRELTRFLQAVHAREYAPQLPLLEYARLFTAFAAREGHSRRPAIGW